VVLSVLHQRQNPLNITEEVRFLKGKPEGRRKFEKRRLGWLQTGGSFVKADYEETKMSWLLLRSVLRLLKTTAKTDCKAESLCKFGHFSNFWKQ
jgi:hypothetical protein